MHCRGNGDAKATLRRLLERNADGLGLTQPAVTSLVAEALVNRVAAGGPVFAADDASDFVSFLVEGVVRVVCDGPHRTPMTLLFAKPGQFIATGWLFEGRPPRRTFGAIAHEDAIVAMWSQEGIATMMDGLPPRRALHLMSYGWRAFSSLLREKFLMFPLSVRDRLLCQLRVLARDFGQSWEGPPSGVVIRILRLTHEDLAQLIVATRPAVTRAFDELRDLGFVGVVDRRVLVTSRGMAGPPVGQVRHADG
jgi:CRP-like cAMP-binding protein